MKVFLYSIIALSLVGCFGNGSQQKNPDRPVQVHKEAKWLNSIKGNGEWVHVKQSVTDDSYLITIYHSTGEYWLQDVFELTESCKGRITNPVHSIEFFDGQGFILSFSNPSDNKKCYLKPTNPIENWPASLPSGVTWVGGLNQTKWVLVKGGDKSKGYDIALYESDHDAKLIVESRYVIEGDGSFIEGRIIDFIIDFDEQDIILSDGNSRCRLTVVK